MDLFHDSVQYLKGVGPQRAERLEKLGVRVCFDLFWLFPHSYYNRSNISRIGDVRDDGATYHVLGRVSTTDTSRGRRGHQLFKARVEDDSGILEAVWFNQAFLVNTIKVGQEILLSGKLRIDSRHSSFQVSEFTLWDESESQFPILPVYPLTVGLHQKWLRAFMRAFLQDYCDHYPEILGTELRARYQLCDIAYAMQQYHFPADRAAWRAAHRRLVVEELLLYRLGILSSRSTAGTGFIKHNSDSSLRERIQADLPWPLTVGQQQALQEIIADMLAPHKMNRLLQGDVGAGKTVVAALAMAQAIGGGYQAALMAPTEILARQHYQSLQRIFAAADCQIACLTGGMPVGERRSILAASEDGSIDILIGTHALISESLSFSNLGLIIIDEQHRFGVKQRALLDQKGREPDNLVMTATPIPRSLALTRFGHLEVSSIRELPPGRQPIKTAFVSWENSDKAWEFLESRLRQGQQVYIVCPLVEESENQDLQDAVSLFERLQDGWAAYKPALIHGRLSAAEKALVMQSFADGECRMLVSTTVIEVGVDVPNASVILIYHAERFGLSQLHQLRGRVGRGQEQSYCILLGEVKTPESRLRLRAMEECHDGFALADIDLQLRGPGDFWGVRQHGLNEFRVARLEKDNDELDIAVVLSQQPDQLALDAARLRQYIKARYPDGDEIATN